MATVAQASCGGLALSEVDVVRTELEVETIGNGPVLIDSACLLVLYFLSLDQFDDGEEACYKHPGVDRCLGDVL